MSKDAPQEELDLELPPLTEEESELADLFNNRYFSSDNLEGMQFQIRWADEDVFIEQETGRERPTVRFGVTLMEEGAAGAVGEEGTLTMGSSPARLKFVRYFEKNPHKVVGPCTIEKGESTKKGRNAPWIIKYLG